MRPRQFPLRVFSVLLGVLCLALSAKADPVVINFDELPSGAPASYLYTLGVAFDSALTDANRQIKYTTTAYIQSSGQADTPPNALFAAPANPLAMRYNNLSARFYIPTPGGGSPYNVTRATTDFVSFHVVGTTPGQTDEWTVAFYDISFNFQDFNAGLMGTFTGTTDEFITFASDKGIHAFVLFNSGPNRREGIDTLTFNPPQVPEPATLLLLGTGLAGVAGKVYRRRKGHKRA